ncbi:T9SS type A sorting domain-containing protein [Gelatiniphilus marinus]|uniref:T9SS type A sorting domain-containing protein n=1 Tax=Gelatiniphilus marinus TaxID=1759464 RepID=A0ABW5JUS5_9FLAO
MQKNIKLINRILLKTSLILFICGSIYAQNTAVVYTPNGTAVTVYNFTEFTQSHIAYLNNQAAALYPNATIISDASNKYNCHAYAWYLTECSGCPNYWMNTPGDDAYWNDNSYVEVFDAGLAEKISYASDDHSAVMSSVAGKYDSKWGQYPVMRHSPTYTPYNSSNLKYYVPAPVGKPDIHDFTLVSSGPSCIDYNWRTLDFGVQKNNSNSCLLYSLPENITEVEWQIIPSQPIQTTLDSGLYSCSTSSVDNAGVKVAFSQQYNPYVTTFRFRVKGTSWSDWSVGHYYLAEKCPYYYRVTPNPVTSDQLTIISQNDRESKLDMLGFNEALEFLLFDYQGNQLKSKKDTTGKGDYNLNIPNLKNGMYYLKVITEKHTEVHRILIDR